MKRIIWSRLFRRWFPAHRAAVRGTRLKRAPQRVHPCLEALEDRTLLSNTYIVNQLGDAGSGTVTANGGSGDIRFCINQADLNPGSTVYIDSNTLFGKGNSGTISLSKGELQIVVNMTIEPLIPNLNPSVVTISGTGGSGASRVFDITSSTATVTISNITIANGNAEVTNTTIPGNQGGDIFNGGTLTLSNDIVTAGLSTGIVGGPIGRGGAIYNAEGTSGTGATLVLDNTIVQNSRATGNGGSAEGGGIFNDTYATLIVQNGSMIENNTAIGSAGATGLGGGIYNNTGAKLQLNGNSGTSIVLADNLAQGGDGINGGSGVPGSKGKRGGNGGAGGGGNGGGAAFGGGVFNSGAFSLQYVNFLGNQAVGGRGGNGGAGAAGGTGTTATGGAGGPGGNGGNGGNAQGGGIYNAVGILTAPNVVFGLDSNKVGNQAIAGNGGTGGNGGAGGSGTTLGGTGGSGGRGGSGGFARGGAIANFGGNVSLTNTTFTSSVAKGGAGANAGTAGNGGPATGNGKPGGKGGNNAGTTGGNGGDAVGGAVFNPVGNLVITSNIANPTFAGNQALAGAGGTGSGGGVGGTGGPGNSAVTGGKGGGGGSGGPGGNGGNAQGGGFYNLVGTVTINGASFTASFAGADNEASSGNGGAGGAGGNGGQGGDNNSSQGIRRGGDGGPAGLGGKGGNAGSAEGGAGENQGGNTTVTSATFTSNLVLTGTGGAGGAGGTGGPGGNGSAGLLSDGFGGNGGNGGQGGTSGPGFGGALAVTASNLTVTNSTFGVNGKGNQILGGAGGAGGNGGNIGTWGHGTNNNYNLGSANAGNGNVGGTGAPVNGGALSARGNAQTVQITGTRFTSNSITSGDGGAGGTAGIYGAGGSFNGINGPGGNGGLAEGGAVFLSTTTFQNATLNNDAITASSASGGVGGPGAINTNSTGSNGGTGGSVQGVGLADINYNLSVSASSFNDGTGIAGSGGPGGSASATRPYTFRGGSGGAGGNVLGGGVFFSNNNSGTVSVNFSSGSASSNILTGGNGGQGGNAGASGHSNISGGAGGAGGNVQGGGLYMLASASSINTINLNNLTLAGNTLAGGNGGEGGAGYNATGGNGGLAQGGGVFSTSLNSTSGQNSTLMLADSSVSGNDAAGGTGGIAGSGTTPNGGAGGAGGNGGNADGAGMYNGSNTALTVVNTTFGGTSSNSKTPTINFNILSGGRGGSGGNAGTPTGVPSNNGGPGGAGGSIAGANVYNLSNANFINDTIVYGQAVNFGVGAPGGSGAGNGGQPGQAGSNGTGLAGGYFAAAGTNSVGNTIIALNNAANTATADVSGNFNDLGNNILSILAANAAVYGFTASGDQFNVSAAQLNLGPLQNNGGLTPTDALLNNANGQSVAIDAGSDVLIATFASLFGVTPGTIASATDQRGPGFPRIYPVNGSADVGAFEYQLPVIVSLNPPSAVEQSSSFTLTITGTGFIQGATVSFGGTILTPTSVSSTQITVTVPTSLLPDEGSVNVTVTVPDGSGVAGETLTSPPATFTITEGTSLTLSGPSSLTNNEGDSINTGTGSETLPAITSSDPDTTFNDLVSGKHTLPPGLTINPNTGVISGTIDPYAVTNGQPSQTFTVTINGVDNGTVQGSLTINWTVNDTTPPQLSTIPNQTNNEGDSISSLVVTATDADPGTFTDIVNGKHTLPPGLSIDPNLGKISGTIDPYAAGTYSVTISAADNGHVGSTTFTWTVNDTSPPLLTNPGNQSSSEGQSINLQLQYTDADAFTAQNLPPGLSINNSGVISGTITQPADGTYNVTITATDTDNTTGNNSTQISFQWTVADNLPPQLTNPGNQSSNEGQSINLQLQYTDADAFTAQNLPPGLSINNSGVISGTITQPADGTYNVTITATDTDNTTGNNSTQISFQWTVADNLPPVLTNPGNQSSNEGATVSLTIKTVDAESFTATGLPSGLSINNSGTISGTIGQYAAGSYPVTVTAFDGTLSSSVNFTWNVSDTSPPSFTNPGTQNNNEGDTVSLNLNPVEADPGSITATGLPTGLTINSTTGIISGTIDPRAAGTYNVTVSATDGPGNVGNIQFTWNVADTTPPALANPGTQTNNDDSTVSLAIHAVDADSFSASGLPPGLSINSNTGVIGGTILGPAGTYQVTVTAFDGNAASSITFPWIVNRIPVSVAIVNVQNTYVGLYQVETVTAQVTDPFGIPVNEGVVTFTVNDETVQASVNNGFATATIVTPMLSFDVTILLNDFFPHALDAVFSDPAGVFGAGSASFSEVGMLFDFLLYLEAVQFGSLAQQLSQS